VLNEDCPRVNGEWPPENIGMRSFKKTGCTAEEIVTRDLDEEKEGIQGRNGRRPATMPKRN